MFKNLLCIYVLTFRKDFQDLLPLYSSAEMASFTGGSVKRCIACILYMMVLLKLIYPHVANIFDITAQKGYLKAVGRLLSPIEIGFHTYFRSYLCWDNTGR